MRYVMRRPLMVSDELSAYMLVALSFLGFAYTWREKGHVRVEVLVSRLSPRAQDRVRLVGLVLTLAFMLEMNRSAFKMIVYAYQMKMRSSTWMMFPLFWPQLTIFVGFVLLTLVLAADILQLWTKIRAEKATEV